jgi:hypothetical protein
VKEIMDHLSDPFVDNAIQQVQQGGGYYDYVKSHYVIKRLNDVLGFDWEATTIGEPRMHEDPTSGKMWISMGVRLTIFINGQARSRDGWDSVEVKTFSSSNNYKNPKEGYWVDLGNNIKQCWSQALKTSASKFGVGLYLYFGGADSDEFWAQDYVNEGNQEQLQQVVEDKVFPEEVKEEPPFPEWGGAEVAPVAATARKAAPSPDDFFNSPKPTVGKGVGFTKGPGTPVSAAASMEVGPPVSSNQPNLPLIMTNAIVLGVKDLIRAGKIPAENRTIEGAIEFLVGIIGITEPATMLSKDDARSLIGEIKKLKEQKN